MPLGTAQLSSFIHAARPRSSAGEFHGPPLGFLEATLVQTNPSQSGAAVRRHCPILTKSKPGCRDGQFLFPSNVWP
ncbi:MAG: hypothetical protein ACI9R3_005949 [Verrucomicrobiales bacterium]|jgi:hypothetical protein